LLIVIDQIITFVHVLVDRSFPNVFEAAISGESQSTKQIR